MALYSRHAPSFFVRCMTSLVAVLALSGCAGRKQPSFPENTLQDQAAPTAAQKEFQLSDYQAQREDALLRQCKKGATIFIEWRNEADQLLRNQNGEVLYEGAMSCFVTKGSAYPYYVLFPVPLTLPEIGDNSGRINTIPIGFGPSLDVARKNKAEIENELIKRNLQRIQSVNP